MAGETLIVEPGRLVAGETRRQDLAFPGAGGGLVTFELLDHRGDGVRSFAACAGAAALPVEEEAQEVARGDRLDLGAQALDGVAVDAGKQAALAPFIVLLRRREPPAQRETLDFERGEPSLDLRRRLVLRPLVRFLRNRTKPPKASAQVVVRRLL